MEETRSAGLPRSDRRFILAAAFTAAVCAALAFWYAVPLSTAEAQSASYTAALSEAARVDLNTADKAALCTLPNVGESRAQAIIDYRVSSGWFNTVDDAAGVPGITRAIIDSWAPLAYVSRRPY